MNDKIKKGMTIIEMMVAISIFSIGIIGFSLLFLRTWKINKFALEMGQSSMVVSQGVNKLVGIIRRARQADNGAYAIKSAANNDLVIYSDYDKDSITERLHFYKNGTDVYMGITDPTDTMPKTYPAGDQFVMLIASRIVNDIDEPIFYYYDQSYSGNISDSPLSEPIDVSEVRLVKIYMHINIDPNNNPENIEIQSFAEFRNIKSIN
jgi:prepilin-type N-terminal cleavage/methylation domain-containing protein